MKNIKLLFGLTAIYRKRYILGVIFLIIVDSLQLVIPKLVGIITDHLKTGQLTKSDLLFYAILITLIALGIGLFRFLWRYLVFGSARMVERDLREKLYSHFQALSSDFYIRNSSGDLMTHATNDINNVYTAIGQGVALFFDSMFIPVFAMVMLITSGGIKLTLLSFIPFIILSGIIGFSMKFLNGSVNKMQEAFSNLTEVTRENLSGIRVVKAFVQEAKEVMKFSKTNQHNMQMNLRYTLIMSTLFPLIMTISAFSFAIALWYGGIMVVYGELTLGEFVAFNGYIGVLIWPIASFGWMINLFQKGIVSFNRIQKLLAEKPSIENHENAVPLSDINGVLTFSNVSFRYPGSEKDVISNINLVLQKGKTLAIIGRTGSAKSTLAKLIVRLFDVSSGEIQLDGIDIRKIPLDVLRSSVAYVPQDAFLFSDTISANIDFYRGFEEKDIIYSSKTAKIHQQIQNLRDGYATKVGERGVTLSGGQKQRMTIARALIGNPALLILDDCLSAVDAKTEEEILADLKKFMKQRTSIIISHRISAIRDSDLIIIIEDGRITEQGTHETLLIHQGFYFELYQKQMLEQRLEHI